MVPGRLSRAEVKLPDGSGPDRVTVNLHDDYGRRVATLFIVVDKATTSLGTEINLMREVAKRINGNAV